MKKLLQKRLNNEKGLTLVELLAVIVILGIIAAIAIPSIGNIIENSRVKAIKADALNVLVASDMYFIDNVPTGETGSQTVTLIVLKEKGFLDDLSSFKENADASVGYKKSGNELTGTGKNGNNSLIFSAATKSIINDTKDVKSGDTISGTTPVIP